MDNLQRIQSQFHDSVQTKLATIHQLGPTILAASELFAQRLTQGGKILICGNGGSAGDAQHFAAELLNRFEVERAPLAGLALTTDSSTLTAIGNDYHFDEIFAKQILGLGTAQDILVTISTSGNSNNIIRAIESAQQKHIPVIALTGKDGGQLAKSLTQADLELRVPSQCTARIQETHLLMIHCFCDLIDTILFGHA
jgi:DnaA initiator-associating protein